MRVQVNKAGHDDESGGVYYLKARRAKISLLPHV